MALLAGSAVLPGASGRELAGRLRERTPGLRVLLMSGYPDAAAVPAGEGEADLVVLAKPFVADEPLRRVEEALAG